MGYGFDFCWQEGLCTDVSEADVLAGGLKGFQRPLAGITSRDSIDDHGVRILSTSVHDLQSEMIAMTCTKTLASW
jgi:hypothetical protein